MDASTRWGDDALRRHRWRAHVQAAAFPAALMLQVALIGCGLLLLARRFAGALAEPLAPSLLIAVGCCVALAVFVSRRLACTSAVRAHSRPLMAVFRWGPTLAIVLLGWALALRGTPLWAFAMFMCSMVAVELLAQQRTGNGAWKAVRRRQAQGTPQTPELPALVVEAPVTSRATTWGPVTLADADDELPEDAWQQTTRVRTAGGEVVTGWIKTTFQPGERTAILHIAFCPPLAVIPELELEQLAGPAARIKAAQVLPQGARLEIRLQTLPVESELLTLEFVATEPQPDCEI